MTGNPLRPALVAIAVFGLCAGFLAHIIGFGVWSGPIWAATAIPCLLALLVEIWTSLRSGRIGLDIVAALSMSAALAFGEYLAAAIVALMYSGGQFLESYADRKARRDMSQLLARAPRFAMIHRDGALAEIPIDAIEPGDRLLIRRGDVVPVDGTVAEGTAILYISHRMEEIRQIIGADALIYQDVDAMKRVVRQLNPKINGFEASCFDGVYITGDVTPEYLDRLEASRQAADAADIELRTQLNLNLASAD